MKEKLKMSNGYIFLIASIFSTTIMCGSGIKEIVVVLLLLLLFAVSLSGKNLW